MKILNRALIILIVIVIISQLWMSFLKKEEQVVFDKTQAASPYEVYGECIDITPFISDIETINDIECFCIIYEGKAIYVKSK